MVITLTHDLRLGRHFSRFDYCDLMLTADGSSTVAVHRSYTTVATLSRNILAAVSRELGRLMAEEDPASGWAFVTSVTQEELKQVIGFVYSGKMVFEGEAEVEKFRLALDTLAVELEVKEQRSLEEGNGNTGQTCGGGGTSRKESTGRARASTWRGRRVEFRETEGSQEPPSPRGSGTSRSRSRGRDSRSETPPSLDRNRRVVEKW